MMILKLLASKARYDVLTPALALSLVAIPAFVATSVLAAEVTTPTDDYVITTPDSSLTNSSTITRVSSGVGAVASSVDVDTINNTVDGEIIGGTMEGIYISGNLSTLMNAGLISSVGGVGVSVGGSLVKFSNSGELTSQGLGVSVIGNLSNFNNTGTLTTQSVGIQVYGDITTFSNSGTFSAASTGIFVGTNLTSFNNSGTFRAEGNGIQVVGNLTTFSNTNVIWAESNGVQVGGNIGSFNNSGTISFVGDYGVIADDDITTFINSGEILGDKTGVYVDGNLGNFDNTGTINVVGDGVHVGGITGSFNNSGTIINKSGAETGIDFDGDVTSFINSGTISGRYAGVNADSNVTTFNNTGQISGINSGISISGNLTNFNNTGTISSNSTGVSLGGSVGSFSNSGTILSTGGSTGIYADETFGSLDNSGTLSGWHGLFHDHSSGMTLINSGKIIGTSGTAVEFGSGDDTLQLGTGATFTGKVDFDAGANTFDFGAYRGNMILTYATSGSLSKVAGERFYYDNGTDTVFIVDQESLTQVPFSLSDMSAGISDLVERSLGLAPAAQQPTTLGYTATQPATAATTAITEATTNAQPQMWGDVTFGRSGGTDSQTSSSTYGALVAGSHAEFSPDLKLGLMAGFGRSNTNSNLPTNTEINTTVGFFGLYGEQTLDEVTLDFQILGGISTNASDRDITTATGTVSAQGDYHGWFLAPQIGSTTPIAALRDGTAVDLSGKVGAVIGGQEGYTETGAVGALSVGNQTYGILNASLELDVAHDLLETEFGALVGTAMVGIFAQAGFGGTTDISIFDATNTAISLGTTSASKSKAVGLKAGLGLEMALSPDINFSGSMTGQFASDDRFGGAARIGLSGRF